MKLPKRRIDPRDIFRVLVVVLLVLILAAGLVSINLFVFNQLAKGGEFLTVWSGARAFLFEQAGPYSTYVPQYVQRVVYERSVGFSENPFILDVPFNILLIFFPLSLIQNASTALVIFQFFLELTLLWIAISTIQHANWIPKIYMQVPFFMFIALNYFTIHSLLEGSLSILVLAGIAGLLLSLKTGQDEIAGALVALLSFKWQMTAPILIFLVLRVMRFRRWRVAAGFGMLTFVLTTISTFLYPGWTIPYLRALVNDMRYGYGYSSFSSLTGVFDIQDGQIAWIFTLIVLITMIIEWVRAQDANDLQFAWTSCLTLAITPLLGFRFEIQELILLLFPTSLIIAVVSERWGRNGRWTAITLILTFFLLSWLAFDGYFDLRLVNFDKQMFLGFPILLIMGLYWIRWWAIRPPRTWLDHITQTGS